MQTTITANELWALLCEQTELLDQLVEFGTQQRQAIEANRMSELLAILGDKQPYLERLEQVRVQLQAWQPTIDQEMQWPNANVRQQCQQSRDRSAQLFTVLIDLEQACERALAESRDQIQDHLKNFESSRTAAAAYQSQAPVPSRTDFSSIG
jgi:DNA anti-recombination protein RmuC